MQAIRDAIDQGAKKAGSRRRLAQVIGAPEQRVSDAYEGRRGLTAEQCTMLAEYIGEDGCALWAEVAISREKDPEKAQALRQRFFGRLTLGGLALAAVGLDLGMVASDASLIAAGFTVYTLWSVLCGLNSRLSMCGLRRWHRAI